MNMQNIKSKRLTPLLKYPGGKESELKYILQALPDKIEKYYEPFLGGGAVYFAIEADEYLVNDKSDELIELYVNIKNKNDDFFLKLNAINHNWRLVSQVVSKHEIQLCDLYSRYSKEMISEIELNNYIIQFIFKNADEFNGLLSIDFNCDIENFVSILKKTLIQKMRRMKKISKSKGELKYFDVKENIEAAIKASFYTHLRSIYNNIEKYNISSGFSSAIYFFIRQTCYSSMFRYNASGKFNVPYGGISYNSKSFDKSLTYFKSSALHKHFRKTSICNQDFYDFISKYPPLKNDFLFIDPPYDTKFSTYAKNEFNHSDQERLASYLINECEANFMVVIKNTEAISKLYSVGEKTKNCNKIHTYSFDKKYKVSFQNRNNRKTEHLIITNY